MAGMWCCCGGCIAPLLPARGEGGFSSHHHRGGFGPAVPRKQALSPSETGAGVGFFPFNFKCTSRKPSFMAIIAELITLWRLQTCVISIFPSSPLARRLENASMGRVNLATAQPSPFSKPFLSWSSPRPHRCCSPAGTLRCFSCSPRSSSPLWSLRESGISSPPGAGQAAWARTWQVLLLPVQMTPQRGQRQFSDK